MYVSGEYCGWAVNRLALVGFFEGGSLVHSWGSRGRLVIFSKFSIIYVFVGWRAGNVRLVCALGACRCKHLIQIVAMTRLRE